MMPLLATLTRTVRIGNPLTNGSRCCLVRLVVLVINVCRCLLVTIGSKRVTSVRVRWVLYRSACLSLVRLNAVSVRLTLVYSCLKLSIIEFGRRVSRANGRFLTQLSNCIRSGRFLMLSERTLLL